MRTRPSPLKTGGQGFPFSTRIMIITGDVSSQHVFFFGQKLVITDFAHFSPIMNIYEIFAILAVIFGPTISIPFYSCSSRTFARDFTPRTRQLSSLPLHLRCHYVVRFLRENNYHKLSSPNLLTPLANPHLNSLLWRSCISTIDDLDLDCNGTSKIVSVKTQP